jgi:hypothetical protein
MNSVLQRFLAEEASPYVRKLIADAMSEHGARPAEVQKRFEFNCFEVTLDFAGNAALIEDVLDPDVSGSFRLQLDEFLRCLSGGGKLL